MLLPRTDLIGAFAHGLDPALFCRERLQFEPDDWQARLLRSTARQCILNCGRQTGKSTVVAALGLHTALYKSGALVLIIAPSQRQSRELFIKVQGFLERLEPAEPTEEETKLTLTLRNGSRVVTPQIEDAPRERHTYAASRPEIGQTATPAPSARCQATRVASRKGRLNAKHPL
jgi:hypothetical protein